MSNDQIKATASETSEVAKTPVKSSYRVNVAREYLGAWREVGETILMSEAQAKFYLPPYDASLSLAGEATKKAKPNAVEKSG